MNLQGFIGKNLFTGRSIPTRKEYQAAAIVSHVVTVLSGNEKF